LRRAAARTACRGLLRIISQEPHDFEKKAYFARGCYSKNLSIPPPGEGRDVRKLRLSLVHGGLT